MIYTIFNIKSGKITKISNCPASLIKLQLSEFEDYIKGVYLDTKYYIVDKKPIKLPESKKNNNTPISPLLTNEEELIRNKQIQIIRQQAIKELKEEGKLPGDYKE